MEKGPYRGRQHRETFRGHHRVQSSEDDRDAERSGPVDFNPLLLLNSGATRPGNVYSLLI